MFGLALRKGMLGASFPRGSRNGLKSELLLLLATYPHSHSLIL